METYKLLVESAQAGHGRTLSVNQVIEILNIMNDMDRKIGELMRIIQPEIIEGEVIDGEVEIPFSEGQDSEEQRLDAPQQEED